MAATVSGRVWKLGDDIDTDIIIPTQYLGLETVEQMKQYVFHPLRPELAQLIQPGDIVVAGKNFGCGSSREQAPEILAALGIGCVIAKSFARIFFRNSFNNGLLLIEHPELPDLCREGDVISFDLQSNQIDCGGSTFTFAPIPGDLLRMIEAGGLVPFMRKVNQ